MFPDKHTAFTPPIHSRPTTPICTCTVFASPWRAPLPPVSMGRAFRSLQGALFSPIRMKMENFFLAMKPNS
jgi:hypothetical protein